MLEVAQPFANHNGGALEFGPDGMLYVALGDGGSGGDPQGNGQNTNALLGKILRIDVSGDAYRVPPDNPFAGGGGRGEIWAYGFRNPWRITFDRETGELWAGDVGQNTWEEVDRVVRGGNYGWNVLEGNECFRAPTCDRDGKISPRAVYPTADGCAVTGGYVYRGTSMPDLRGWYVYADYCSGVVWALNPADDSPPVELASTGQTIPSFAEAPDGELYFLSFGRAVYRLTSN
jgi:glucose/arabinose dehydrogenase